MRVEKNASRTLCYSAEKNGSKIVMQNIKRETKKKYVLCMCVLRVCVCVCMAFVYVTVSSSGK